MSVISKSPGIFKRRRVILNSLPFIIAAMAFISVRLAVKNPQVIESWYSELIYPLVSRSFSRLSGLFSFSLWDVFWMLFGLLIIAGLIAVILKKLKFDLAPLILGLVLGPMIEKDFRQSLFIARGDLWLILNRPITMALLGTGLAVILATTLLRLRRTHR